MKYVFFGVNQWLKLKVTLTCISLVVLRPWLVLQDLGKQIDDYTSTYQPEDQNEWKTVLSEIREFEDVSILLGASLKQYNSVEFNLIHYD